MASVQQNNPLRTTKQALALARKLFGKTANVRFIPDAPAETDREQWRALSKEQRIEAAKQPGHVNPLLVYRCSIGKIGNIGGLLAYNRILGQADTWPEAFLKAQNHSS